jgi:AAA+ superfamily predicted ATPase
MDIKITQANAAAMTKELQWLGQVIETRMKLYWQQPCPFKDITEVPAPELPVESIYAQVVEYYRMKVTERIILSLALAPHLMPHLLDVFFIKNSNYDRGFTEFGGIKGQNHGGFLPTGETVAFILAANDLEKRFELLDVLGEDHFFRQSGILKLTAAQAEEPFLSGILSLSNEYLSYFTLGTSHKPDFNMNFPAKRIYTDMDWDDLVLEENTLTGITEIRDWLEFGDKLMDDWGMHKMIKPGFRTLFYGPPGTGKTLTACLLGKSAGLDVYRIDLSMVVSKFIGETEKNLAHVFDQAAHKNWILFFDEADALFGKRTQVSGSNDRYANQEVSYLLQRIEDFPGVVILATNLKANIDDAFSRRFQSMIHFPIPGPVQRLRLWKQSFSAKSKLEDDIDLEEVAEKYEMTGGAMINISRYSSLMALKRGNNIILKKDLMRGIRKEFGKEGKTV